MRHHVKLCRLVRRHTQANAHHWFMSSRLFRLVRRHTLTDHRKRGCVFATFFTGGCRALARALRSVRLRALRSGLLRGVKLGKSRSFRSNRLWSSSFPSLTSVQNRARRRAVDVRHSRQPDRRVRSPNGTELSGSQIFVTFVTFCYSENPARIALQRRVQTRLRCRLVLVVTRDAMASSRRLV
jgi:hypothetical protein